MLSINSRMLIAATIILAGFLGVTGITLENSFRVNAEAAMKERLQLQLHTLIASMDQDDDGGMTLAYPLYEARFFTQDSGLYAEVLTNEGRPVWASPSMAGVHIPLHSGLARGEQRYEYLTISTGETVLAHSIGLTWGDNDSAREAYTFVVAETLQRLHDEIAAFRKNLWASLGTVAIVLLVMLAVILRWGLAPLRRVADDLGEIEAGHHLELKGEYPRELRGLTDNLNALIRSNREHEERYRASLGDLAHSLKTPLAVLRGAVDASSQAADGIRSTVEDQIERMDQIVGYQLQRAAASGRKALAAPVDVEQLVTRVVTALKKVYAEKQVEIAVDVLPALSFHCDEGDLMELLGNLVDNACKYCRHRVEIGLRLEAVQGQSGLLIEVCDDGPGISEAHLPTVLERGGRLDTQANGHGLGLAMISDIVALYDGHLEFQRSRLGGALVAIWLPGN